MSLDAPDPCQATLDVSARDDLGRPVHAGVGVFCSGCDRDVSQSRKAHYIERSYLVDRDVAMGDDTVPVFGWRCEWCHRVLALNPNSSSTTHDLGPGTGWIAVEADLATGDRGHVLVPFKEIYQ